MVPPEGVSLTDLSAHEEASRCLFCHDAPCNRGCPAGIDVAGFIRRIYVGDFRGASSLIHAENPLAYTCGVLCPADQLCARYCPARSLGGPIRIGDLHLYAVKRWRWNRQGETLCYDIPVAVIGAGPAGLSAAFILRSSGYPVDVFEMRDRPGGLVTYGVPPHRLDKTLALDEMESLLDHGIRVHYNSPVGDPCLLLKDYGAVFISTGLVASRGLGLPGEHLPGIVRAGAVLEALNQGNPGGEIDIREPVVVIGGGNTAMDVSVALKRLGVDMVTVLYRRSAAESPAWPGEVFLARQEGVFIRFLVEPVAFEGGDRLERVRCRKTVLVGKDAGGRAKAHMVGRELTVEASTVVLATGYTTPGWISRSLPVSQYGWVSVDPASGATPIPGIFAGGDVVNGGSTVVQAVAEGKRGARGIMRFLEGGASQ